MHIISSGRSLYLFDQHHLLELDVTRWVIIVRDSRGRRIGVLRAVEG